MTKRGWINWAIWIGVVGGIYCFIYASIPALAGKGLMWMTFVAMPIYFNVGAKPEDYVTYVASMLAGVVWGMIYLWTIGCFAEAGVPDNLPTGLGVAVVTIALCIVHFLLPTPMLLKNVPMMFGAVSMTFSQGGANLPYVIITMFGGITRGLVSAYGARFLDEQGRWKFSRKG